MADSLQSTGSSNGGCVIAGGLGVADDLYVGGVLVVENGNLEYKQEHTISSKCLHIITHVHLHPVALGGETAHVAPQM